ncbi:MAG: farnesyl diphosphate synthase [Planctomycetota bacterium]
MKLATDPLSETMRRWSEQVDEALDRHLGERLATPDRLREAMRYSVFAGGKRLRPILVLMAADACGAALDRALAPACSVELVHTYSLIHDDLPAMDDDDLRRGQPTCHRKFGEAIAILAGDALLTLAFEILADIVPSVTASRCIHELASASGASGMVGGQVDDLFAQEGPGTLAWLESLHSRKTGALLTASLRMGGWIANATEEQMNSLTEYGRRIGLAFQIADDLLDVEGDAGKLGKQTRKDDAAGKLTYPGLLGVAESRQKASALADAACACLRPLGPAGSRLAQLADYIVERDR